MDCRTRRQAGCAGGRKATLEEGLRDEAVLRSGSESFFNFAATVGSGESVAQISTMPFPK